MSLYCAAVQPANLEWLSVVTVTGREGANHHLLLSIWCAKNTPQDTQSIPQEHMGEILRQKEEEFGATI